jgi:hypothetical protein
MLARFLTNPPALLSKLKPQQQKKISQCTLDLKLNKKTTLEPNMEEKNSMEIVINDNWTLKCKKRRVCLQNSPWPYFSTKFLRWKRAEGE